MEEKRSGREKIKQLKDKKVNVEGKRLVNFIKKIK